MKVQHIEDVLVEHGNHCRRDGRERPTEYDINADDFDDMIGRLHLQTNTRSEDWGAPGGPFETREIRTAKVLTAHGVLEVSRRSEVHPGCFYYSVALGVNAKDDDAASEAFKRAGLLVGGDR